MEGERTLSKMAQAEFTVHFAVAKYRLRKLVGTHHSASGRETADLARFGGGRTMVRPYKLAKFRVKPKSRCIDFGKSVKFAA